MFVMPVRVVPPAAIDHLICCKPKQEKVLLARCFRHFDGRAVTGSNRERAVHHEFHIAGAAGFVAGRGDLIGYITSRNQPLGERNAILGQKQYFKPPAHQLDHRRSCRQGC